VVTAFSVFGWWQGRGLGKKGRLSSMPRSRLNQDVPMTAKTDKVLVEVDARHEAIVRRALALAEEMEQLALTATEGQVVHECEATIIDKGRQLQSQLLSEAVRWRIEAAEKKGRRCGSVHVDGRKRIKDRSNANS
jgi:hypothetical protein